LLGDVSNGFVTFSALWLIIYLNKFSLLFPSGVSLNISLTSFLFTVEIGGSFLFGLFLFLGFYEKFSLKLSSLTTALAVSLLLFLMTQAAMTNRITTTDGMVTPSTIARTLLFAVYGSATFSVLLSVVSLDPKIKILPTEMIPTPPI
jgi:hypothetical protein